MYKVFVNDTPIILTDSLKEENSFSKYNFENMVVDEIIYKILNGDEKGIQVFCNDLENNWLSFLKNFKVIVAGGGLVLNKKNEILFIYRGNRWDFPKGRKEEGETIENTAIREVEEECGISNLIIHKFLLTTYHFFLYKGKKRIKETHWFLMHSDFESTLTPQLEEGITEVLFKNETETKNALKNTYANIQLVYDTYLASK